MVQKVTAFLIAARPRQWLKNAALLTPLLFSEFVLTPHIVWHLALGVIVFCLLSSSNYIINDVLDAPSDRKHPYKRLRPVASNKIPTRLAFWGAVLLGVVGIIISNILGDRFFIAALMFMLLHYLSYAVLRRIAVADVLAIASGYLLRVWAGEAISGVHLSVWLFLSVLSLSLLLAIGKRRAELSLLVEHSEKMLKPLNRKQFPYSEKVLDAYVAMFANSTYLTYAYFTFLTSAAALATSERLYSSPLLSRKWMMVSIPFVIYGVMRYLQLVYTTKQGSMDKAVYEDKPLLLTLALWVGSVVVAVYYLH